MFSLTIKTTAGNVSESYRNRYTAEAIADRNYKCKDVYAIELINGETGELLYYKHKGWE